MTPAERLRAAADLIEQRASEATPGPWQPEYAYNNHSRVQAIFVDCADGDSDACDDVDCIDGAHSIGGMESTADNLWVLIAHPSLGPPLATWLRAEALHYDMRGRVLALSCHAEALAVADVILGGAR